MPIIELYKPRDYQKQVHDAITKHLDSCTRGRPEWQKYWVVKSSRQTGKTMFAINEMLRFSMEFNNSKNDYVSPTNEQSHKFYIDFINAAGELIAKTDQQRHIITMINGSTINCHSALQKEALRGYTTTGLLILDECISIPNDILNKYILPWTNAHKACVLAISTPLYRMFWFYEWFIKGLDKNIYPKYESFDFTKFDLSMVRNQQELDDLKTQMPKAIFNAEYLGQFIDFESTVFGDYSGVLIPDNKIIDYNELFVGIDWSTGNGNDDTVVTAFNESGNQVFIEFINNMEPMQQISHISNLLSGYHDIKEVNVEINSIGTIYHSALISSLPNIRINKFVTTNNSKRELVDNIKSAIENKNIRILQNDILLKQFLTFEQSINTKTNTVTYNAKQGSKDDGLMATMIAYDSYRRFKEGGNYNISFLDQSKQTKTRRRSYANQRG